MAQADAKALFVSLPPVDVVEITGEWRGRGIATGHPLDRLLQVSGWVGKRFDGPEDVHPLLHNSIAGDITLNPGLMPLTLMQALNMGNWPLMQQAFFLICPLFCTLKPRARLRMVDYEGVSSAAMIYDQKPITDHFRRIDDTQLMGLMDLRGDTAPFFFLLEKGAA